MEKVMEYRSYFYLLILLQNFKENMIQLYADGHVISHILIMKIYKNINHSQNAISFIFLKIYIELIYDWL